MNGKNLSFCQVQILNDLTTWLGGLNEKRIWKYKELHRQGLLMTRGGGIVCWEKTVNLLRFIHSTKIHRIGYYVPCPVAGPGVRATNKMDVVPDLMVSLVGETDTQRIVINCDNSMRENYRAPGSTIRKSNLEIRGGFREENNTQNETTVTRICLLILFAFNRNRPCCKPQGKLRGSAWGGLLCEWSRSPISLSRWGSVPSNPGRQKLPFFIRTPPPFPCIPTHGCQESWLLPITHYLHSHLGVVCTSGFRVARKVTKAVTAENKTQITRNLHQCSFTVK